MTRHVIELNGQKYDTKTGRPLSASVSPKTSQTKAMSGPKHLDGFSRRPTTTRSPVQVKPVHAKTQKSQTLMRKAVQKPATPAKIHAKVAKPANASTPAVAAKAKIETTKPGRIIRASAIGQSSLISKFGKAPTIIESEVVPVKDVPSHVHTKTTHVTNSVAAPANSTAKAASKVESKSATKKSDIFEKAIAESESHRAPKTKRVKAHHKLAKKLRVSPRVITASGMTVAVLGFGSVIAYQNMPEISMKMASARAGLNASLPSYQPAGFSLNGPIKHDHGEVTVNYKSNSDTRSFTVSQKNSSWNSETLLENFVTTTNQPYQTFQANGRTIYIYDGGKATWVDGGVWYNIDSEANLNSDQLLKIADSL